MGYQGRTRSRKLSASILSLALVVAALASPAQAGLGPSTTTADPATTSSSAAAQMVTLTATVTGTGSCNPNTFGVMTFQVKDGMTNIGSAVTDTDVDSDFASVSYTIPAATPPGSYTIEASFSDGEFLCQDSMDTDTLTIEVASDVGFSKFFAPATIGPGSTTTLTFVIDNSESMALVTDIAFTDVLPAGITIADPASASTDCTDGVLTAPDGGTTISLTDGRLGADESCVVTVNVVGTATATNTSGDLTSSEGNSGAAVATLTVDAGLPGLSKEFHPSTISLLGTSTLTFTIDNLANGSLETSLFFIDDLPAGVAVASPANIFTDCAGTVTVGATEGTESPGVQRITFSDGSVAAASTCIVELDVTAEETGSFDNVSGELESGPGGVSSGFASATLEVPVEFLVKGFINDPVAPGGIVDLRFIVTNVDRDFPATAIAFTDDLDPLGSLTGLAPSGALPTDPCGVGSLLAFAPGTGELSLSGGTLGPGETCEFDVSLAVPVGAAAGTYMNTTGPITATIDGEGVIGNMATDELVVNLIPVVTKEFIDDPAPAGGTVTLEFTLTNTSTLTDMVNIAFTDDLNTAIPGLAANELVSGSSPIMTSLPLLDICGDGSKLEARVTVDFLPFIFILDPTILEFTGGSLAAAGMEGDSCTFEVELDIPVGASGGIYTNTTGDITGDLDFFESSFVLGGISGDVEIIGAPQLTKEFTDDPVPAGGTATVQFTISHDEAAPGDATLIEFEDDLATLTPAIAGLEASAVGPNTCSGSVVDISTPTLIDFSSGTLAPGESCSFSVDLSIPLAAAPGPHTNTTSAITATVDGVAGATGNKAEDDLLIEGLSLTKEFLDDPVIPGELVTLEFVIENVHPSLTATGITMRDNMASILGGSPDITAADASPVLDVCGSGNGTITWMAAGTFMTFSGGSLAPGEICTFSVVLVVPSAAASGTYVNTTGDGGTAAFFALMPGSVTFPEATDFLVVDNVFIGLAKEFTDDPVAPGGTANLRFTITNLSATEALNNIAFSDDLDAALGGLVATGLPVAGCGGMAETSDGGMTIDFTGGTLAASASCFFDVSVSVPLGLPLGTLALNTTTAASGSAGVEGPAVVGDPASDTLRIGSLTLEKAFDGPVKAGQTVDLTFTLTNLGDSAASMLGFSDDLESVVSGLLATGLPFAACGGTVQTFDGGSTIVFTDGSLAAAGSPGDSCMFTVTLSVPAEAPFGSFPNVTSDLSQAGLDVADPAEDDLVVEPPIDFSKAFSPDPIGPGSTTTLTFTIANLDSGALAEDVAFTDVLPAGMVIATPSSAFTDCTDAILSAPDGGATISLAGARVGLGTTCTVTVNVTAAAAGEYDNLSGELTSTAGSGGMAAATLTVDEELPGFSKSFDPATIPPGGTSTLTFLIDYSAAVEAPPVGQLDFNDTLPAGLVVATPSNAVSDCEAATFPSTVLTADPGTGVISFSAGGLGGVLAAGETCTVVVDVTAASDDLYENVSGELTTMPSFEGSAGFATALLDVREGFLVKSFTDDPVPPGGTVTMELTINNPSRDFPATDITFTDDLDAVLSGTPDLSVSGALPTDPCGAGSTLTVEPPNVLTLMGGSLPAEGSCTFSVTLDVPVGAETGTHENTTSSITATIDGETVVGDPGSDDLRVVGFPILTKEFLDATTLDPDPVVGAGDDIVVRFTITNTSTTSAATDVAFFDELTAFLPFPIVASASDPTPPCGAGSALSVSSCGTECEGLDLTGGMLAAAGMAGDSCTFDVTLTLPIGLPQGTYVNTTDEITATVDGEAVSGFPATDTFDIVAAPRLTKEFLDDPVQPGGTVTLEFTLEHNTLAPGDAVGVSFTDDLAAVLPGVGDLAAAAGELPSADLCGPGNGMVVGTAGDTLLTFSGATLTPGQICTFSLTLDVPADADAGSHTNKTSNVVASVLGIETTEDQAQDDLVVGGVVLTKQFTDDPVIAGDTVTLEFVITNQTSDPVTDIFFEDLLDPDVLDGLTVTSPMPLVDPCGTGSLLEVFSAPEILFPPSPAIDEALRLSGGSLDPTGPMEGDGVCSFSVTLMVPAATLSGNYVNRTRDFEATLAGMTLPFPEAQDELVVSNEQLLLTKEFTDDPVVPGGTVTLELGISTLGGETSAADLAFTDDLEAALAGLAPAASEVLPKAACGGTLDFAAGVLTFSGGSFTGGDCGISVVLEVPMAVPFGTTIVNTTSTLTGTIGGLGATGEPASDDLIVDFFTFEKFFDGLTTPSGTPVLTFMITNLSMMDTITDLAFTDDLDAVIPGLVATSLPSEPCGVGSSIAGTSLLALTGGTLLPGGTCTFSVDLLVPAAAVGGSFLNTTSDLEVLGFAVAAPATAFLDVDPPPTLTKTFVPDFILPGQHSNLTFVVDNSASIFDATDIAFFDDLPAGLEVAEGGDVFTTCAPGALTAVEGSDVITFLGGELPAGGSCLIEVSVTGFTPGIYANTSSEMTSSSGLSAAAVDSLFILGSGGPCFAPDGENLLISTDSFLTEQEFVVCDTITAESASVFGPDGHLILRAGVAVVLGEGFFVGVDGKLTIALDPSLIP